LWIFIKGIIKRLITGKKIIVYSKLPEDISNLQDYAMSLLDKVNQGEISIHSIDHYDEEYSGETFSKLDNNQQK
jgi:hypothetical protein